MITASSESDYEMLTMIISNPTGSTGRLTVTLPANTTLGALHQSVAAQAGLVPGTFELRVKNQEHPLRLTDDEVDTRQLFQAGITNKCRMELSGVDGATPVVSDVRAAGTGGVQSQSENALNALGTVALWSQQQGVSLASGPQLAKNLSYCPSVPTTPNAEGFVGLVNQGATCYLSSLLQSLYMTPEFRAALYDWHYTGSPQDEATCITLQLQKLFVALQTSTVQAVGTTALSRAFGWDEGEAFVQHDVQELLRVLFDALEAELKPTPQGATLQRLFRGELCDYVQCKQCLAESSTPSAFEDLNLAIRSFGVEPTLYASVEEALSAFLEPETLDGDNQYSCEKCGVKRDAFKGIKLRKLPHILTIGLKRFDFDLASLSRIKLNHRVAVPLHWDVGAYCAGGAVARQHSQKRKQMGGGTPMTGPSSAAPMEVDAVPPMDDPLPPTAPAATGVASSSAAATMMPPRASPACAGGVRPIAEGEPSPYSLDGFSGGAGGAAGGEGEGASASAAAGGEGGGVGGVGGVGVGGGGGSAASDDQYELYSVLMHSGTALAGHYYAFIRDFAKQSWYKFNDRQVQALSAEQLEAMCGTDGSRASAYMLMYRRVTADNLTAAPTPPAHLRDLVTAEVESAAAYDASSSSSTMNLGAAQKPDAALSLQPLGSQLAEKHAADAATPTGATGGVQVAPSDASDGAPAAAPAAAPEVFYGPERKPGERGLTIRSHATR